jgi:DNA-binding response OmpR family regulator
MKTVMLVEDERAMRRLVEITLGSGRYHVLAVGDGESALRLAATTHVDLALVDVAMPGMDGFTVCQRLKALSAEARPHVVMLTAHASPSDRERGRFAGADDYVAKPFSPVSLLDCVRRLLAPATVNRPQPASGSRAA